MAEPEWLNDREQRAWRAFLAMQEELRRQVNSHLLRDSSLSEADYSVLATLSDAPEGHLRIFEIRTAIKWEKTRLTHQLTRMISRGLVERLPCASDPRGAYVALTEEGRSAITNAAPLHVAQVRRLFIDVLSPRQLDSLATISETVLEHLQDDPEE